MGALLLSYTPLRGPGLQPGSPTFASDPVLLRGGLCVNRPRASTLSKLVHLSKSSALDVGAQRFFTASQASSPSSPRRNSFACSANNRLR